MRTFLSVLLILICFACNSNKSTSLVLVDLSEIEQDSINFSAIFQGKKYKLSVNCSNVLTDYFQFKSDKLDNKDTNGDGIVVSGFLQGKKLTVTFMVNDKLYSTPKLEVWSKLNGEVHGDGYLYDEDGLKNYDFQFQLNCN